MTDSTTPKSTEFQLLPDWLKETSGPNPYANFQGDDGRGERGDRRGPRGNDRPRPQNKGPRDDRPKRNDGDRRPPRDQRGSQDNRTPMQPPAPVMPADVGVEFGPESKCLSAIAAEVKSTHHAYAVFSLAHMFLQQPARYKVKLIAKEGSALFRLGPDGPIATSAEVLTRESFHALKNQYYTQETTEVEGPKGNFSNVARCRLSGVLLGPTNHHAYQPALRSLFEKRFSRRMSFQEYSGKNIEVVNDPAVVEEWKNQCKQQVTWTAINTGEEAARTFTDLAEVEKHFRETHLPTLLVQPASIELSGPDSINIKDRSLSAAIRDAWYRETKFPGNMVRELTIALTSHGLHFFKHRKRYLYVSSIRPQCFSGDLAAVRENVNKILALLTEHPGLQRKELADHLLTKETEAEVQQKQRLELASDLHWLIAAGHVIEFQGGKLDLPLSPKAQQQQQPDQ